MNLELIAISVITIGITESEILKHYDYRKNKSIIDIRKAQEKARKNGMCKTEYEISMCEAYLKGILKKKRVNK